ncbi:NAD(P)-dependent alcohol dehydrogenase [Mycobacterium sp. pV006]|uniref:NAD(P)-dependent alcohol dehydrogenase n=1 Tax=Mycobacterium sp. pV006 TaxID=3238983 RepID=UPI00351B0F91
MKITAAVLRGEQAPYTLEELELPDPGPGQILVRVVGAGHCHTDVVPRAGMGLGTPPIVVGHEGAGVVEAVGTAVDSVSVGDHVVLSFDSCGRCRNCRQAQPAYCDTFMERNLGGPGVDGAEQLTDSDGRPVAGQWFGQSSFATHAVVDDKSLPLELLGPLGCGIQTGAGAVLEALRVPPGTGIVVTGTGAVGLSAIMAAKVAGAGPIIAVDINAERLELARELGATDIIVSGDADLTEQIRAVAPAGVDYGLDTTGLPAVIGPTLNALTQRGVLGLVGVQQGDLVIDPLALAVGRTLRGILEGDAVPQTFIPRLIALWQDGRFPFDKLIQTFDLTDINTVEQRALAGEIIKPVLLPPK